jgi:trigger factor
MQVSIEQKGSLGRRMTVAVPAEQFEQALASRFQRLSKQVKVPGFRPGKIPMKVIEARYGGRVLDEVAGELIQNTFREAIGQEGLKPVAGPHIHPKSIERGKELAYTAEFEVYPEIAKVDLAGHAIERPGCSITDEDVERSVQNLRKQRTEWRAVEREARLDDRMKIDFEGKVDGEPFEGGQAKDFGLVLGAGSLIPGFEEGLIGAKAEETRTLDLEFPATYPNEALAGKPAKFEIKVREVAEPVLPEANEDFARQFGIEDGSVDTLYKGVRANLNREMAQRLRTVLRARVFEALVDVNKFEVPETLLNAEIEYIRRLHNAMRNQQGQADTETATAEESLVYEATARRRVAQNLTIAEVIRTQGIKAEPEKVRARVMEMAQEYESPEEFVRACYAAQERLAEVEAAIIEEQVVEYLLGTATVTEMPLTFQELVQLNAAATAKE